MKFILNEQYILDERFILDEGVNEDKAKIEHILQRINECRHMLNSANNWIDNLNTQIEQVNNNKNALEKIPNVNNKLTKTKQLKASIRKSLNKLLSRDWAQYFNELSNELNKSEQNISLDLLSKYLLDIYNDSKNNIKYIDTAIDNCIKASSVLNNTINKNIENLSEDDKAKLEQISKAIDENLVSSNNGAENVIKGLKSGDTNAVVESCNNINKLLKEYVLTNKIIDWNAILNNSVKSDIEKNNGKLDRLDKTIDSWYATVWKGYDLNFIKGLFKTISYELKAYGWNEQQNPFIKFLKYSMKNTNTFISEISKDAVKYGIIHNAVVDNKLSEDDLEGTGKLGRQNIIFNPAFYKKSRYDMKRYLFLQNEIINKFYKQIKDENSVIYKSNKYGVDDLAQCVIDIFYKPGNVFKKQDGRFSADNLRTCQDIIELSISIFGETFNSQSASRSIDGKLLIINSNITDAIKNIKSKLAPIVGNDKNKLNSEVSNIIKAIDKYSRFSVFLDYTEKQKYLNTYNINFATDIIDDTVLKYVINTYFNEYSIESFDRNPKLAHDFVTQLCEKH